VGFLPQVLCVYSCKAAVISEGNPRPLLSLNRSLNFVECEVGRKANGVDKETEVNA
jgi:hypothetical protein